MNSKADLLIYKLAQAVPHTNYATQATSSAFRQNAKNLVKSYPPYQVASDIGSSAIKAIGAGAREFSNTNTGKSIATGVNTAGGLLHDLYVKPLKQTGSALGQGMQTAGKALSTWSK